MMRKPPGYSAGGRASRGMCFERLLLIYAHDCTPLGLLQTQSRL